MSIWMNEPCSIDTTTDDFDYALFIDESGIANYKGTSLHNRWFTLCACLFKKQALATARDSLNIVKQRYWQNGQFSYKTGPCKVIIHMKDVAYAANGSFSRNIPFCMPTLSRENFQNFIADLDTCISEQDFKIFSVSVDKLNMILKYKNPSISLMPYDPYTYALELILERVNIFLSSIGNHSSKVIIISEKRGQKEDSIAHKKIVSICNDGTTYIKAKRFCWMKGAYFCNKCTTDGRSYYGLEYADYCAYPIKMHFAKGIKTKEFQIIEPKIYQDSSGCAKGYGMKKVP